MTWTWRFDEDGSAFVIFDPDGNQIETVPNNRGIVNGMPPDVRDVVVDHDTTAVLKENIEQR